MMGCGAERARNAIRKLLVAGKVRPARIMRTNMAGVTMPHHGYEIVRDN